MQANNRVITPAYGPATFTASFNTGSMDVSQASNYINVNVVTSAVTGTTPSVTLSAQWSYDGGTTWVVSDAGAEAFAAITANGSVMRQFTPKGPLFRLSGTVTGTTPSFTVKVNLFLI